MSRCWGTQLGGLEVKRIFISDLHLDEGRPELAQAFARFLAEVVAAADQLYILGDFFEAWLGDDDDRAFNRQLVEALAAVKAEVFVMHGNRDFLLGQTFCQQAGAQLLPDPWQLATEKEPVLLMHGDSLCTRDHAYMEARTLLRSHAWQQAFLSKPLEERAALAAALRGESKAHTRQAAADIMDVTPEEVERVMQEAGVALLIHGHTHRPAEHLTSLGGKPAKRLVLGDWHTSAKYVLMEDGVPELLEYQF